MEREEEEEYEKFPAGRLLNLILILLKIYFLKEKVNKIKAAITSGIDKAKVSQAV
jgi:hypothetical protein